MKKIKNMKKFILSMFLMIVAIIGANGQTAQLSGNFGATVGVEPHNSNLTSYPVTFNIGVGALFENGTYIGVGLAPGLHSENYHSSDYWCGEYSWSETHNSFIMPYYGQLSYINPQHWYGDIKIGAEYVSTNGEHGTFFFMAVTPLGYTFDYHNSIGIGWRYHTKNEFQGHSIALTYNYTF